MTAATPAIDFQPQLPVPALRLTCRKRGPLGYDLAKLHSVQLARCTQGSSTPMDGGTSAGTGVSREQGSATSPSHRALSQLAALGPGPPRHLYPGWGPQAGSTSTRPAACCLPQARSWKATFAPRSVGWESAQAFGSQLPPLGQANLASLPCLPPTCRGQGLRITSLRPEATCHSKQ